jgi:peptide deformylase
MILKIYTDEDPILRGASSPVDKVTPELNKLALNMMVTMTNHGGIGLAACQVGQKIQLIVIDTTFAEDNGIISIMFNPEILHGEGSIAIPEKCLSLPGKRIKVNRSRMVRIKYLNTEGKSCIVDLNGLAAIVAQHEIEHLSGILLIDYERN